MQPRMAVFLTREPGTETTRFHEYLALMQRARDIFWRFNPEGDYIVLTDGESYGEIAKAGFQAMECVSSDIPLMCKTIAAARSFLCGLKPGGTTLIADADCVMQKPLDEAFAGREYCSTLVTYNDKSLRVNNIAYTRRPDVMAGILMHAASTLAGWPMHLKNWWGDQECWDIALGDRIGTPGQPDYRSLVWDGVGLAPCSSHNCFVPKNGDTKSGTARAVLVHFKGERKQYLPAYCDRIIERLRNGE